jgi:hypothetical protein
LRAGVYPAGDLGLMRLAQPRDLGANIGCLAASRRRHDPIEPVYRVLRLFHPPACHVERSIARTSAARR